MTIQITITGDNVEAIRQDLRKLMGPTLDEIALDKLKEVAVKRFDEAGFNVSITDRPQDAFTPIDVEATPAVEPTPAAEAPKPRGNRKGKSVVTDKEEALAALKGNGESQPDPAADKAWVLEQLNRLYNGNEEGTKAFADRMALQYSVARISMVPTEHFPAVRTEMVKEFNLAH